MTTRRPPRSRRSIRTRPRRCSLRRRSSSDGGTAEPPARTGRPARARRTSPKQSPAAWFERYGDRIVAIHVKDLAVPGQALNEDGWADVGYGTLDWQQLYSSIRAKTKATYFVMEHDNPSDVDRFARRSIATVRKWK